jgi:hypothetical protein
VAVIGGDLRPELLIRRGRAQVEMKNQKLTVKFSEIDYSEGRALFEGPVSKGGVIKGKLIRFFMHEDEFWTGHYSEARIDGSCLMKRILLQSGLPDSSVLVISNQEGLCQ